MSSPLISPPFKHFIGLESAFTYPPTLFQTEFLSFRTERCPIPFIVEVMRRLRGPRLTMTRSWPHNDTLTTDTKLGLFRIAASLALVYFHPVIINPVLSARRRVRDFPLFLQNVRSVALDCQRVAPAPGGNVGSLTLTLHHQQQGVYVYVYVCV